MGKANRRSKTIMETRKAPRLPISSTTKLKVDPSVKGHFGIAKKDIKVQIIDISVRGIGVLSKYFIPKGVIIDLEFMISGGLITVRGEVKSAISGGKGLTRLGVKFIDIDKKQHQTIARFIKENERRTQPRLNI